MITGDYSLRPTFTTQLADYEIRVRDPEGSMFLFWLCLRADEPTEAVLRAFREIARHTSYRLAVPTQYQVLSVANVTTHTVSFGPF